MFFLQKRDEGANRRNGERLQNSIYIYIYIYNPQKVDWGGASKKKKKAFLLLPTTAYGKGATLLRVPGAMTLHL